jgi:hypothetical protein
VADRLHLVALARRLVDAGLAALAHGTNLLIDAGVIINVRVFLGGSRLGPLGRPLHQRPDSGILARHGRDNIVRRSGSLRRLDGLADAPRRSVREEPRRGELDEIARRPHQHRVARHVHRVARPALAACAHLDQLARRAP